MSQATIALIIIMVMSALFRDLILTAAAGTLLLLSMALSRETLAAAGKPAFSLGIFFLMLFILMPLASEKIKVAELLGQFKNPQFFIAVAVAAVISYCGGRGVEFMQQSHILFAVVVGTLIGVLFLRGLPAGLVIAAGIVSVFASLSGSN